jgi:hypothetical protein
MIRNVKLLCVLALFQAVLRGADHAATAADVVELVFTSIYTDHDDKRLARDLASLKMTEQLSPHIVLYFKNSGIGTLALEKLERLRDESASLTPPPEIPLAVQPLPTKEKQNEILQRAQQYAQSYVRNLPNFLCDQVTRRYTNLSGFQLDGHPHYGEDLHFSDSFTQNLRFVEGSEEAVVQHRSKKRATKISTKEGQSLSSGEFGVDMMMIFGAGVNPMVQWHHWEDFERKRTAVFSYRVDLPKSQFTLEACCTMVPGIGEARHRVRAAVRGLVYIDDEKGVISRLVIQPVSLPPAFRIKESDTVIDYGDVVIGGRAYRLPLRAVSFVRSEVQANGATPHPVYTQKNRNEISFINYRKFESESVLTFTQSKEKY